MTASFGWPPMCGILGSGDRPSLPWQASHWAILSRRAWGGACPSAAVEDAASRPMTVQAAASRPQPAESLQPRLTRFTVAPPSNPSDCVLQPKHELDVLHGST